eukprot:CAMPEP_0115353840 /NCGR_PEP_ID=MMETSP0270-20121206/98259_1 /TAXON_ID=71861 /ORGANISM="Scrippsiella trochoidea, Strain CCMP3099" /LENGTH=78 /DNA_ID=CAMNT_0002776117 /DNA_START=94 /DNA_END=326 /DNA_ORIENTATION=-
MSKLATDGSAMPAICLSSSSPRGNARPSRDRWDQGIEVGTGDEEGEAEDADAQVAALPRHFPGPATLPAAAAAATAAA